MHHRAVVKRGINEELDRMKETYEGMDDMLGATAKKIASEISKEHDLDLNVTYFPQIGFLVTIPANVNGELVKEGLLEEGDWEEMFTSNNCVYYKDFRTREMDGKYGDIYAMICGIFTFSLWSPVPRSLDSDLEIEIVHEVVQEVLKYEDMLMEASDICGELDRLKLMPFLP